MRKAYKIYMKGGQVSAKLYWDLLAEGIHPTTITEAISMGLTWDEICPSSEDCLDHPNRLRGNKVLRKLKEMGQDETNIHPQAFEICQITLSI